MIRCKYLRPLLLLLLLVAAVLSFSACSSNSDAAASIWVVTEETDEDGMNQQVRQVIKAFQADHPDVTVTLDILPTDSSQREIVLKQLRTKIMAGAGCLSASFLQYISLCNKILGAAGSLDASYPSRAAVPRPQPSDAPGRFFRHRRVL